jgi:nucleoid-associated protein YgaU
VTLNKARFSLCRDDGTLDPESGCDVLFNPTEYATTKAAQFAEHAVPGLDAPIVQFVRGQAETMNLDLFFDTSDPGEDGRPRPVTAETDKFYRLVWVRGDKHAPPICWFSWGAVGFPGSFLDEDIGSQRRHGFRCVVDSVQQRFTYFAPDGVPLRAVLTVRLREYRTLSEQLDRLNRQSADHTRYHTVRQRETLAGIAAAVYGDPSGWRRIAAENNLSDPMELAAGTLLVIPPVR